MINQNKEDYLQAMYRIIEKDSKAKIRSVDIAKELNVSKPAVSQMLKRLKSDGLVIIERYSFINLSSKGQKMAKNLVYKHRVIENFLQKTLKLKKEEIHEEAHKLEHAFSDKVIKKLDIFLKK